MPKNISISVPRVKKAAGVCIEGRFDFGCKNWYFADRLSFIFLFRAEMIELLALVIGGAYLIASLVLAFVASVPSPPDGTPATHTVSIIVAARNEEHTISALLDSLLQQTFPHNLLEILVVDDRSTDRTAQVVEEYARRCAHLTLVRTHDDGGQARGKTNALTQGIDASSGDIIMITDADCIVPPEWVEEITRYFADPRVGIVAGFTALQDFGWFTAMQSLDWLVLLTIASAGVKLGMPLTAIGNNLSVRRTAYDRVGGYRAIPFSVTEDYALFRAVTSTTPRTARFPLDRRTLVVSMPCPTWRDLHRQKKRWFTGAKNIGLRKTILFGLVYAFNLFLLLGTVFAGVQVMFPALALKVAGDLALTAPSLRTFSRWRLLRVFPIFELYFIFYVLYYPLILLRRSEIIWKERTFRP